MFGSKNGLLNDFSRGRKKVSTSSAVAKPFRNNNRAIQVEAQISLHEIGPPFNCSGGAMIHRLCTDYSIRWKPADKWSATKKRKNRINDRKSSVLLASLSFVERNGGGFPYMG
jgi:hypothetical protein